MDKSKVLIHFRRSFFHTISYSIDKKPGKGNELRWPTVLAAEIFLTVNEVPLHTALH